MILDVLIYVFIIVVSGIIIYNSDPDKAMVNNTNNKTGNIKNSNNNTLPSDQGLLVLNSSIQPSFTHISLPVPSLNSTFKNSIIGLFDPYVKQFYPKSKNSKSSNNTFNLHCVRAAITNPIKLVHACSRYNNRSLKRFF